MLGLECLAVKVLDAGDVGGDAELTSLLRMSDGCAPGSRPRGAGHIWQARFHDFNVWTERKRIQKLRYMPGAPPFAVFEGWDSTNLDPLSS
jgi:hypothetical protein